jgi:hypothetical protein
MLPKRYFEPWCQLIRCASILESDESGHNRHNESQSLISLQKILIMFGDFKGMLILAHAPTPTKKCHLDYWILLIDIVSSRINRSGFFSRSKDKFMRLKKSIQSRAISKRTPQPYELSLQETTRLSRYVCLLNIKQVCGRLAPADCFGEECLNSFEGSRHS